MAIYIAMHKPYPCPAEDCYRPIQVGAGEQTFAPLRDREGENIAEKNPSFCELTALYWLWRNDASEVQGLAHYRRHFRGAARSRDPWARIATARELEGLLAGVDMLLPRKRHYIIETNWSQYAHAHREEDLRLTRQVLADKCPEYAAAFDAVMARRSGHRFNMLVARREVVDRYCSWLFPILFELERRIDISGYDAYNRRVFGFIGERLLDVWVEQQKLRFREVPVINLEGENWPRKGLAFCLRKLKAFRGLR